MNRFSTFALIWLMLFMLIGSGHLSAQSNLAIKAGGTLNVFGAAYGNIYNERLGYQLGLTSHIKLGKTPIYLKPEILYTYKDFKLFSPVYLDDQLNYTDVLMGLTYLEPTLNVGYGNLSVSEGKKDIFLLIYGGIQPGFLQKQNLRFRPWGRQEPFIPDYKEFDAVNKFNLALGLGFEAIYGRLHLELKFTIGVIPLYSIEKDDDTVNTTAVTVGYRLF